MPDQRCYIFSETSGLVEHCVDLCDEVKTGQLVVKVHNIERTGTDPEEYYAEIDGIYTGRHFPWAGCQWRFSWYHCGANVMFDFIKNIEI